MRKIIVPFFVSILLVPTWLPAQDSKENSDFKLAVSLYNDKMYDLALEQFRQFIDLYPNSSQSADARYYTGLTQFKLKKYDDARYSFQNFALSYPENLKAPEAWMNVAEVYLALNNLHEAALAFERVKTFSPKSKEAPTALRKAAEYYGMAGSREDAARVLRVLTQEYSEPKDVLPGHLMYASLLMGNKDYDEARSECKKVIDATKDPALRSQALLMSAEALDKLDRYKDAESALNELISNYRSSTSYSRGLLLLGTLKKESGNLADAIKTWRTLADDSARTPRQTLQDAYLELGDAELLNNNYENSLGYFERAGRIGALRTGEAWFRAGEMAERLGNSKKMAEYYGRAVDDTSSTVDRRMVLIGGTKAATSEKNFVGAVLLAEEYRAKYPLDDNLPRILFESAEVCARELKDYRKAIDLYNETLDRFPLNLYADNALYGLGIAQYRTGLLDESIRTLESLAKRFPSSLLIDSAKSEAQYIKLFELKNKETGLEKLALLVGDVIAQESKGNLAYRLAEIYFHELKDYRQAAAQYRVSLNADLEQGLRPAAWYNLALSFECLDLRDSRSKDLQSANADAASAVAAYDSLLTNYPVTQFTDDAALAQLILRVQLSKTPVELRKLGTRLLAKVSLTRYKIRALLVVANAYLEGKDMEDAALTYKVILDESPKNESSPEALFQFGKTLMGLADRDSAAIVLESFLESNPAHQHSAEAAFLLGQYESAAGQAALANKYYDLLEKKYFYTDYAINLDRKRGDAYFNAGDFAKASELYTKQIRRELADSFVYDDVPPELFFKTGYSYEKLGNNAEARRYYTEYITRVRKSDRLGQVYYSLASIARSESNSELAAKYLQESIQYAPASSEEANILALEAADLLFEDGQYADAITRYTEVAQRTKKDSLQQYVQTRTIVSYFRLDNVKEADKRSALFLKEYPKNEESAAEFEFERGQYFLRKEDSGKALARFETVTRRYKNTRFVPEALFWSGRAYELAEKPQLAISLYDSVLNYYQASKIVPRAELSLGNIYYNLEQWDPAARYYKDVVDSASRAPDLVKYAMSNLAMAYKQLKLFDAAMELDRKYIEQYPNDDDIVEKKIDIAVLYQNLGYYDQSILQLQSLLEMGNPSIEAELRYYIGEAYFYKGNYQQAILDFLKVPYLVTKRGKADWISTSYYMAGQSYEKMSKFDLATAMYRKIIESKETDTEFKTAAKREIERVQSLIRK